jgi:hypothetical protein
VATLTYAQLEGLWMKAAAGTKYGTRTWAALMAAIAEAESGGNPGALNPNDNNGTQSSFGLWQISTGTHQPPSPQWADPATNAQLALGKLQGEGLGAWGTYTSGAYRAYLSGSTTPDVTGLANSAATVAETTAAAASDCLVGFGGIPGTAWFGDIGGAGGNLGQGCFLTRSEARAVMGALLMTGGALILASGVALVMGRAGAGVLAWGAAPVRKAAGGSGGSGGGDSGGGGGSGGGAPPAPPGGGGRARARG